MLSTILDQKCRICRCMARKSASPWTTIQPAPLRMYPIKVAVLLSGGALVVNNAEKDSVQGLA